MMNALGERSFGVLIATRTRFYYPETRPLIIWPSFVTGRTAELSYSLLAFLLLVLHVMPGIVQGDL